MSENKKREIASKGGRAAQMSGRAHHLTSDERRRGGSNSPRNFKNRPISEVREMGRRGGRARHHLEREPA